MSSKGKDIRLVSMTKRIVGLAQRLVGESTLREISKVNQWLMFGGNPQRNARSGSGFPLINPNWEVPTVNDPDLERAIKDATIRTDFSGWMPDSVSAAVGDGDTIVMRSFDRMIGVNSKTGKRIWVFPPWKSTVITRSNQKLPENATIDEGNLTERMWLDSLYGQASSDGQAIFVCSQSRICRRTSLELSRGGLKFSNH